MESLLKKWDGERVVIQQDQLTGAWIIIAMHSSLLGPASGGTRMKSYPTLTDAVYDATRLAASMTYKFAIAGMARGGGKAVIALPPDFEPALRPDLLRRYGILVRQLGGLYETGPDVGTSPEDMDIIAETGSPHVFCQTPANGGCGSSAEATALGVFSGLQAVAEQCFGQTSLANKRVLVQGAGNVGAPLIYHLLEDQAEVLFNDVDEATIHHFRDEVGLPFIPEHKIYETPCDIFSPCALGGVLNETTIPRLQCQAVAGAANNQLATAADADRLHHRGILYAPDYAINVGGAMAVVGIELDGWDQQKADAQVKTIRDSLLTIFSKAKTDGITTEVAAKQIVEARLAAQQAATS
ncbi:MAG: Glu/Leu/Phe/Val dehydrogenase dimerization domain-containing protein [Chloroflexota bacterium]